jgi:glycosyltransferase involved in cell wall biosynthesis
MGRPVIVSNIGAVTETVIPHETGLVFEAGNAEALAEAIAAALALDPLERKAVGQDAIRFVQRQFTRERMCHETLRLYAEVLAERAGVRRGVAGGGR